MRLNFKTYGQGEPLLILHGLFGSLDNWHSVSLKLGERFQVLAVDQRNHGHSPHSPEMDYRLMAEDVRELLEARLLPWAHVLGHSMGGKTAMQFALLYPAQVQKLVVVDIAPRVYSPRHTDVFAGLLPLNLASFQTRSQIENALAPSIPDLALRRFLLKNAERDPGGGFRWRFGLQEIYQNYQRLGEAPAGAQPFNGPVLFIHGEGSDYLKEEDLGSIQRLFPQARLASLSGAGHLPHTENPGAFVQQVKEFLLGDCG
ncbi:MAG TPA: alpha/beta fold hydrolase [Candidatus Binatia bacterium]|jgi:esterase|nr:alpha/beta fold hydrolase [Candidatus Binatia bacterium]